MASCSANFQHVFCQSYFRDSIFLCKNISELKIPSPYFIPPDSTCSSFPFRVTPPIPIWLPALCSGKLALECAPAANPPDVGWFGSTRGRMMEWGRDLGCCFSVLWVVGEQSRWCLFATRSLSHSDSCSRRSRCLQQPPFCFSHQASSGNGSLWLL